MGLFGNKMPRCQILDQILVDSYFAPREFNAHKGIFGRVLVCGGDFGMPGSVRLAAEGALRMGTGLVMVATHSEHVAIVVNGRPELLCYGFDKDFSSFEQLIQKATFIVVGPGLGQTQWSENIFSLVQKYTKPLLIDADGLTWLYKGNYARNDNQILTPHPGEAARLLNCSVDDIQADRVSSVQELQKIYGGIVVLKGAQTLISANNGLLARCDVGNPGMASAGMGDLLSGIIAGAVSQGLDLWRAALAGVFIHATAGDKVAAIRGERGILSSDLLTFI